MTSRCSRRLVVAAVAGVAVVAIAWRGAASSGGGAATPPNLADDYTTKVRPLVQKYCLGCHSTKVHKGDLDLERFASLAAARKDLHAWQQVAEQLEVGDMPPRG